MITIESQPENDFQDIINTYWKETEDFPKPEVMIVNDVNEAISRIDLNNSDYLLINMPSPENFKPRGNIHYYDRVITGLTAIILTKESRQRVKNLSKMVRAIVWDRKHNFPNYQLIKPIGYRELVNTDLNIWRAEITFQVEAHCILVETLS
jgi:hypothetical protein